MLQQAYEQTDAMIFTSGIVASCCVYRSFCISNKKMIIGFNLGYITKLGRTFNSPEIQSFVDSTAVLMTFSETIGVYLLWWTLFYDAGVMVVYKASWRKLGNELRALPIIICAFRIIYCNCLRFLLSSIKNIIK